MDKTLILNKIIEYKKFKSDAEFARFLEIPPQNLSKWKSRNTYDVELLYTKCPELNPEWLLIGKEPMLKEPTQPAVSSSQPQENDNEVIALLKENNAILKDQLRDKEEKEALYKEKIKRLELEITNLEKDLQQHKKTAQPTVSDILHQPAR